MSTNPIDESPWKRKMLRAVVTAIISPPAVLRGVFLASGFIVEVDRWWFWLTAEHCFEEMDKVLDDHPDAIVRLWPFFDNEKSGVLFRYDRRHAKRLSKEVETALKEPLADERIRPLLEHLGEQDIGVYLLKDYYANNLRAAGVVPLTKDDVWTDDPDLKAIVETKKDLRHYIAGAPVNEVEFGEDGRPFVVVLHALRIFTKDLDKAVPVFRPGWKPEDHAGSIKGMSGGPAYIVAEDKVYWFGIQSTQYGPEGGNPSELKISLSVYVYPLLDAVVKTLIAPYVLEDGQIDPERLKAVDAELDAMEKSRSGETPSIQTQKTRYLRE